MIDVEYLFIVYYFTCEYYLIVICLYVYKIDFLYLKLVILIKIYLEEKK